MELTETYVVGIDGEGLIKTLVRGGSASGGVHVRFKRRVYGSVKVREKVT